MAAGYFRILLLLEIAAFAALVQWLHVSQGWGYGGLVLLAAGSSLGIRLIIVCVGAVISNIASSPRAPEYRINPAGFAMLVLRAWHSIVSTNYWQIPFDRWALRPDPPLVPSSGIPVLFVHGYFSSRGYFNRIVPQLEARGVAPIHAPNFPSAFVGI